VKCHFWATVCKTVHPMLSDRYLSVLSCLSATLVYCGQTVGQIKMKLGVQVGLGPGHIVLDGDPAPHPQRTFSSHICCGQMDGWIKIPLGMEGLGPGDFVLDGDPALPFQKRGGAPSQFSAHFYCGQTAGCIKMPVGMEVGLSPGDFMLDGDPAPTQKGGGAPSPILRVEVENFEIRPEV